MSIPTIERRFSQGCWLVLLALPMLAGSAWCERAPDGALVRVETTDAFVSGHLHEDSRALRLPYLYRTSLTWRWTIEGWIIDQRPDTLVVQLLGESRQLPIPHDAIRLVTIRHGYSLAPDGGAPPFPVPMLDVGDRIRVTTRLAQTHPEFDPDTSTPPRRITGSFRRITPDSLIISRGFGRTVAFPLTSVSDLQQPWSVVNGAGGGAGLGLGLLTAAAFTAWASGEGARLLWFEDAYGAFGYGLLGAAGGALGGGILSASSWRDIDLSSSKSASPRRSSPPPPVTPELPSVAGNSRDQVSAVGLDIAVWTNGNLRIPPYIDFEARDGGGMGLFRSRSWEFENLLHLTAASSGVFGSMYVHQPGQTCEFSQGFFTFQLDFGPTLGDPAGAFLSLRAGPTASMAWSSREESCGRERFGQPLGGSLVTEVGIPVSARYAVGLYVRRGSDDWHYSGFRVTRAVNR